MEQIATAKPKGPEIKTTNLAAGIAGASLPAARLRAADSNFGAPRGFLGNRFVYAVISQRARGLSIGINMNPDKLCNFDCAYCEVDRDTAGSEASVDLRVLAVELEGLLEMHFRGRLRQLPFFANVPEDLLQLRGVALSGDGEPTLSAQFEEIVAEVVHIRSRSRLPFFKMVLITNCTGLDRPEIRAGLAHLTPEDEIWCKLDCGTQAHMDKVNRPGQIQLQQVLDNILLLAKVRPVIIQSLFPLMGGLEPPQSEIDEYVQRLKELASKGAQISQVQVYSAHRTPHRPDCGHVPLKCLSAIANRVREVTGLKAEVF